MIFNIKIVVLVLVFAGLCYVKDNNIYQPPDWLIILTKILPIFALSRVASSNKQDLAKYGKPLSQHDRKTNYISKGLFICLFGDIAMELHVMVDESYEKIAFQAGLVLFLIGHIFYIRGFLQISKSLSFHWLLLTSGLGYGLFTYLQDGIPSDLFIPTIAYTFIIMLMIYRALACLGSQHTPTRSQVLAVLGAFVFAFSDFSIAVNRFKFKLPYRRLIVMSTYFLAQMLICASTENKSSNKKRD